MHTVCASVSLSVCFVGMCGSVSVCVRGCVALWLCGSVPVCLCGSVSVCLCGYVAMWPCVVSAWLCGRVSLCWCQCTPAAQPVLLCAAPSSVRCTTVPHRVHVSVRTSVHRTTPRARLSSNMLKARGAWAGTNLVVVRHLTAT
eukprot:3941658-Rhodomonas_salina.2